MAPEQLEGRADIDERVDVWAMGVVAFELITGQLPFEGHSVPSICAAILTAPARLLRALRADVPPALEAAVRRCWARDKVERTPSLAALVEALQPFLGPNTGSASAWSSPPAAATAARGLHAVRGGWAVLLALVVAGLVAGSAVLYARQGRGADQGSVGAEGATAPVSASPRMTSDAAPGPAPDDPVSVASGASAALPRATPGQGAEHSTPDKATAARKPMAAPSASAAAHEPVRASEPGPASSHAPDPMHREGMIDRK